MKKINRTLTNIAFFMFTWAMCMYIFLKNNYTDAESLVWGLVAVIMLQHVDWALKIFSNKETSLGFSTTKTISFLLSSLEHIEHISLSVILLQIEHLLILSLISFNEFAKKVNLSLSKFIIENASLSAVLSPIPGKHFKQSIKFFKHSGYILHQPS